MQPGAVTWESLAAELGMSPSTARARLRPLGVASLVELQARWAALTAPDHMVVAIDDDGPVVAIHGSPAWLHLQRRTDRLVVGCASLCEPLRPAAWGPPSWA